ncbi:hypothetical protein K501DRAFT_160109, partial [Backusella circina FSU 941]
IIHPNLATIQPTHHLNSRKNHLAGHLVGWSSSDVRPIVGCTVSGGMIQVYRISGTLYRLLNVLQDLLLMFEPTMPLLGSSRDFKDWYCKLSGGEESTIHGDLVELFLRLSPPEQNLVIQ